MLSSYSSFSPIAHEYTQSAYQRERKVSGEIINFVDFFVLLHSTRSQLHSCVSVGIAQDSLSHSFSATHNNNYHENKNSICRYTKLYVKHHSRHVFVYCRNKQMKRWRAIEKFETNNFAFTHFFSFIHFIRLCIVYYFFWSSIRC